MNQHLDIASLSSCYAAGADPAEIIAALHQRIARDGLGPVWIALVPWARIAARIDEMMRRRAAGQDLPLFGIPFAVKDNIDLAGVPTTAGCPAFAYVPERSAAVVAKLEAAGAVALGKTNLDQFATGLVGTRSPYGIPSSVFDPRYIAGGSSSGSAVAVALGLVSFALGTDTAGSGRVPAACNNIVGLKPTKGWLSTTGVVPACRSLDCVSVFAGTVEDALAVARIAGGFDADDPFSRRVPDHATRTDAFPAAYRFGVPAEGLEFFCDRDAAALFAASVARLERLGGRKVEIDFAPFLDAGQLLYGGPWVAERLAAIEDFALRHADDMLPVTREIILGAGRIGAVAAFRGLYRLAALARRAEAQWAKMDVLLLPTTGTIYRIDDVLADPIGLNTNLGRYTSFANLLDLAAIAVPAGFLGNGLPFGVSLIGRAFSDGALAGLAGRLHRALGDAAIGATGWTLPEAPAQAMVPASADTIELAVMGAHLSGEALNPELTRLGATLARTARTAAGYSLYALSGAAHPKPGLVFDGKGSGHIEVEIWSVPSGALGWFVAGIPAPLGIGTIALADGSAVKGFLCEAHAVAGADDITRFGSWRAYRQGAP
ncbi:MAG TPA: allophanate hydrolase [Stellaceae bacterium]|nr:allophanate hydrolase [Stellaceae bacterium]